VEQIGNVKHFHKPEWSLSELTIGSDFLDDRISPLSKEERFQKRKEQNPISKNETVQQIGQNDGYKAIDYDLDENNGGGFLDEHYWYAASAVSDGNDGMSRLLKSLPAQKLQIIDEMPLPTGYKTKIVWLSRVRDIIEEELLLELEKEKKLTKLPKLPNLSEEQVPQDEFDDDFDIDDDFDDDDAKEEVSSHNARNTLKPMAMLTRTMTSTLRLQQLKHVNSMLLEMGQDKTAKKTENKKRFLEVGL